MPSLRIKKQIDSDILYLPELKNLIGKHVEIIILTESDEQFSSEQANEKPGAEKGKAFSASALLKYAGSWHGDDLENSLEKLYLERAEAEF